MNTASYVACGLGSEPAPYETRTGEQIKRRATTGENGWH